MARSRTSARRRRRSALRSPTAAGSTRTSHPPRARCVRAQGRHLELPVRARGPDEDHRHGAQPPALPAARARTAATRGSPSREPYGRRASATTAIFFTDAVTGKTSVWKVPSKTRLTGNARALGAVRSLAIPGIAFTGSDLRATNSGGSRAVEPRPVFIKGKLYFVVSIIPDGANNVTKTVVIDAATNQSAGIFDARRRGPSADPRLPQERPGRRGCGERLRRHARAGRRRGPAPAAAPARRPGTGKKPTEAELRKRLDEAVVASPAPLDELKRLQRDLAATTPKASTPAASTPDASTPTKTTP